jgi:hypothetical protein
MKNLHAVKKASLQQLNNRLTDLEDGFKPEHFEGEANVIYREITDRLLPPRNNK